VGFFVCGMMRRFRKLNESNYMKINCTYCDKLLTREQIESDICWNCAKPIKDKLTPIQLKAIDNDDVNEKNDDNGVSDTIGEEYSYPALETISEFIKFIAWLSLIISIIIAFMANENRAGGFSILISLVSGLISFVFLLASSEIIKLYINIAKDLRSLKSSIIKDD